MLLMTTVLTLALSGPAGTSSVVEDPPSPLEQTQMQPQTQEQDPQDQIVEDARSSLEETEVQPQTQQQDPQDQQAQAKAPPTPAHTGIRALFGDLIEDVKQLPAMQNLYIAAIGGGLAAAAHPADQSFNVRLRSHYDAVNKAFAPGKYLGDTPEQVALSLGAYAIGRWRDMPKLAHLGMDLVQAQLLSEMLVQPIKYATHRQRPDLSDYHSFPSGHAAVTFASATVIERHLGWRKAILGYTIASYVAASRLHDNVHYLSDVIFGAAVGSIAGRTVVHHAADYWAFTPVSLPGGGMALLVSRTR